MFPVDSTGSGKEMNILFLCLNKYHLGRKRENLSSNQP